MFWVYNAVEYLSKGLNVKKITFILIMALFAGLSVANELDLDKLLDAEEDGDLLTEEKSAAHSNAAGDSAVADQSSTRADGQSVGDGEGVKSADSVDRAFVSRRRGPPPSKAVDAADDGPAIVEEGRTINFAQNLKEYKSPRVAMLLSLLLPGLGQAYSRSYVKASAFGAAEVVAIGAAVYFNSVAKTKKSEARKFADEHFEVGRVKEYDRWLRDELEAREISDDEVDALLPYDTVFYNAATDKSTYYYESIRGKEFTPGWINCDPPLDSLRILIGGVSDTIGGADGNLYVPYDPSNYQYLGYIRRVIDGVGGAPVLGYSSYQAEYNSKMDKSNSYRDAVNYMFYVILLNHIASAIDAGFTARAHNARLLGEDNSAWNRVSVEQQFVFTGSGHSPGVALRLRF